MMTKSLHTITAVVAVATSLKPNGRSAIDNVAAALTILGYPMTSLQLVDAAKTDPTLSQCLAKTGKRYA